ncbi:MAG: D-alanine--D-alanine ligase A [Flavobacteriales bacterium]|nr:D-alanine--D-alanine ligase A [Flavobacteriales bacterium]
MKNIAILMGGTSKEKEISLKSAETIYQNIDKKKYNAYKVLCLKNTLFKVIVNKKQITINNTDFSFKLNGLRVNIDKVFMMIHGVPGENGELCEYFEKQNIPYTSCNEQVSRLTFNKFQCNQYLSSIGYKVPKSSIHTTNYTKKYPCIVKPSCSGSSFGVSKVYNQKEMKHAIEDAKTHDNEIIIEEFIDGRELTCGVFRTIEDIQSLPITEIISENDIFDYDAKYNGKAVEETPAHINKGIQEKVHEISKKVYKDMKLSGIVRIDFIVQTKTPYIIEINTVPGFSTESIIPKMLKCANINITEFITQQLEYCTASKC